MEELDVRYKYLQRATVILDKRLQALRATSVHDEQLKELSFLFIYLREHVLALKIIIIT